MKTNGKKTEKKKVLPRKNDEKLAAQPTSMHASTDAPAVVLDAAPIEVFHEKPAMVASVEPQRRTLSNEERRQLISQAAYYRAQRVGFGKTNPIEDWLLAEREVDAMITSGARI